MKKVRNILFILCLVLGLGLFVACNDDKKPDEKPTETKYVDYVAETKLTDNVTESSNFFGAEGVGYATVVRCVDGDTAVFITNGKEFTARFLGVDTPESTGQVEEWGKTASLFTADKLNTAVSVVVQTNGGAAQLDTTGNRYLTYVWYQPSAGADYRLLNLELVQEGLSLGKSATATRYEKQLVAAQNQANHSHLRIHGNERDENYYYGDAKEVTIKYILENYKDMVEPSMKVAFDCTITREDGLYVYAQDFDAETNRCYSILLYKGYNLSTKKIVVGNRLRIVGNVQLYQGIVQISGMQDIAIPSDDNIKFISKNYQIYTSTITAAELKNAGSDMEKMLVKLENLTVTSMYTTEDTGEITITGTVNGETATIRTAVLYTDEPRELVTESYFEGKTITVVGLIETFKGKKQIKVVSIHDVTIVE